MCQHFLSLRCGGGKQGRPSGRPRRHTAGQLVSTLTAMAPPFFILPLPTPTTHTHPDMMCTICCGMLDRPIELECGNMVCLLCCTRWLSISTSVDCPCCYTPLLDHTHSPSKITMAVLGSQLVVCGQGCRRIVQADQYKQHVHSKCQAFFDCSTDSPSRATLSDVLNSDKDSPATPTERKVAHHLIKKLLSETDDGKMLSVPTLGQVYVNGVMTTAYLFFSLHMC